MLFVMTDTHTISMATSRYTWEDVDRKAKKLNLDRSSYIQRTVERDMNGLDFSEIFEIMILMGIAILPMALLVGIFAFSFSAVFMVACIFVIFWRLRNAWMKK